VRFQRSEGISLSGADSAPATAEELQKHMHLITDFSRENTYPTTPASALREMVVQQGVYKYHIAAYSAMYITITVFRCACFGREVLCGRGCFTHGSLGFDGNERR
jgi:hypothetical protein